jgi:DNA-binding SARP family transcriptional activator
MEFQLLGRLEVWHEGKEVEVRGSKQRALLAVLLLHANQVVSSDRLMDELWGDEPPDARKAALRVRMSQLRKSLDVGGPNPIVTRAPGYVLELRPDTLDLLRFERLLDDSAKVGPEAAAELLRGALALWRGGALADFAYEPFAEAAIARLEELRLLATEKRIEADLALGRHAELVPELEALVVQHPLREHLRGQLMLALYRCGRQAEALAAYQSARRTLVDDLGIEPGPALQQLEQAVLRQDADLELDRAHSQRSVLVAWAEGQDLDALLAVAEPLARKPPRELIVARLVAGRSGLGEGTAMAKEACERIEGAVVARPAAFTSTTPGRDTARLAAEQDVDLVLITAGPELLDDEVVGELLRAAPCDVALAAGGRPHPGRVLVPFVGGEHDWGAIELGAWLAGAWGARMQIAGPATADGRDSSRLLASASLAVQRAFGVPTEPLLVEPGPDGLLAAAREAAVAVIGLSERWADEGVGPVRGAFATSGRPTLFVRKGLRPGGLAPVESQTRFTWSLRA